MSLILISCGKKGANNGNVIHYGKQFSLMLTEVQCTENGTIKGALSREIEELFSEEKRKYPQHFFFIAPKIYSEKSPLILSLDKIEKDLKQIKDISSSSERAQDLYNLYNENSRYEDQKCQFQKLVEKKRNDIRPHLNLAQFCIEKYQSEICPDLEYVGMSLEKEKWVRENIVNLCQAFSINVNCEVEYGLHSLKNTLGQMIRKYYRRFQDERYNKLFTLNENHQKFKCQSINDKVFMTIKILKGTFDNEFLENILVYVEKTWRSRGFSIKFELVESYASDVVTILPSLKGISYVPESNNRLIYLSTALDRANASRVLAHEFGHVLGFPDCYIEFFDNAKKELIYYEISKEEHNVMCSLRENVYVREDYFTQLVENSCLFN